MPKPTKPRGKGVTEYVVVQRPDCRECNFGAMSYISNLCTEHGDCLYQCWECKTIMVSAYYQTTLPPKKGSWNKPRKAKNKMFEIANKLYPLVPKKGKK